jgi:TrmH family RNA methyltransferase
MEAPVEMIAEVYLTEGFADKYGNGEVTNQLARLTGKVIELVSEEVFRKMSATLTPQGILCVLKRKEPDLSQLLKRGNGQNRSAPFWLVLEDIQDPGNLGTIMRTAEGAGVDGIIMSRGCVDIYNPKTIRSTMGSIFRVPFVYVDHLETTINLLKESGVRVFAAGLSGAMPIQYDAGEYVGGTAFLIGNEGKGLTAETAGCADVNVRIPMEGQVESLNAAAATAILLYEVYRQRRSRGSFAEL